MKIFINLPTWLGDSVMASVAIYAIKEYFKDANFVFYGSFVSIELYKNFPNSIFIKEEKSKRYIQILKLLKSLGVFDYAFSFRSALSSKIILRLLKTKKRFCFDKNSFKDSHQVLKYLYFIENALNLKTSLYSLQLPIKPKNKIKLKNNKKLLGLNPGGAFGNAKRWQSEDFAKVALYFSNDYEIIIFGSTQEKDICDNIEQILVKNNIYPKNLCGKTSIKNLCQNISFLDLFISNDSGSLHIAAVYKIKTIAIFGPTKFTQTSPWDNKNALIVHLDLPCMPCMQRICPLGHHKCMKDLSANLVIEKAKELINLV